MFSIVHALKEPCGSRTQSQKDGGCNGHIHYRHSDKGAFIVWSKILINRLILSKVSKNLRWLGSNRDGRTTARLVLEIVDFSERELHSDCSLIWLSSGWLF